MNKKEITIKKDVYSGMSGKLIIMFMNIIHRPVHKWLIKQIGIKSDDKVLDIGCGGGGLIALVSKETNEITSGIDYSDNMVLAATKRNRKNILEGCIEIVKASVSEIPYKNDSFNIITLFETIQFWPDIRNDLIEVRRVLGEKGRLYIMNRLPEEGSKWYDFSQFKVPNDYKAALEEAGFNNIIIDITSKKRWIFITAS